MAFKSLIEQFEQPRFILVKNLGVCDFSIDATYLSPSEKYLANRFGVVKLIGTQFTIIKAVCIHARTLEELANTFWADREDGGPDHPYRIIYDRICQANKKLSKLHLKLFASGSLVRITKI